MDENERRAYALQMALEHHRDSRAHMPTPQEITATAAEFNRFLEGPQTSCQPTGDELRRDLNEVCQQAPYSPPQVSVTVHGRYDHPSRLDVRVNGTDSESEHTYPNASSTIHMLDSLRCSYPADMQVTVFARSDAAKEVLRWCRDVLPADRVWTP